MQNGYYKIPKTDEKFMNPIVIVGKYLYLQIMKREIEVCINKMNVMFSVFTDFAIHTEGIFFISKHKNKHKSTYIHLLLTIG